MSVNDAITTPCCCLIPKTLHLSFQQNESSKKAGKLFLAIIATSVIVSAALLAAGMVLTYFSAKITKNNNAPFKIIMIAISIFMSISAGLISFYALDGAAFKKLNKMQNPSTSSKDDENFSIAAYHAENIKRHASCTHKHDFHLNEHDSAICLYFNRLWDALQESRTQKNNHFLSQSWHVGKFTFNEEGIITKYDTCTTSTDNILQKCKHNTRCKTALRHLKNMLAQSSTSDTQERNSHRIEHLIDSEKRKKTLFMLTCFFLYILKENAKTQEPPFHTTDVFKKNCLFIKEKMNKTFEDSPYSILIYIEDATFRIDNFFQ